MSEDTSTPVEVPAAPLSPLEAIRNRRKEMKEALLCTLQVPRLEPPVYVQLAPVAHSDIRAVNAKLADDDEDDWVIEGHAIHIAKACRGIGEVVDGRFRSLDPSGKPLLFNDRLRELLDISELEAPNAPSLVRALFATDGDVMAVGQKLTDWSGYGASVKEAELLGN